MAAEQLGAAVLYLRTDDTGLDRGMAAAETRSRNLQGNFDKASASATALTQRIGQIETASRGMARSADDIAEYGRQLDQTRARFNPMFAAIQQYRSALGDIRDAHRVGAITADEMASAISRERQAALASIAALKGRETALGGVSRATRNARMQQQMMLFQLNDIGVSLASGMNPLMVMIQQGSQISQIYGNGQGGVGRALKDTGSMIAGAAGRFPLLTGAIALGTAALAGLTYEVNEAETQTVKMQDVALATWQVIADGLMTILKPVIDELAPWFQAAWDLIVAGTVWVGNRIVNTFRGTYENLTFIWSNFPDIIAAAMTGAVNLMIAGVNAMVRAGVTGVNTMIRGINAAVAAVGADRALELFGFSGGIGEIAAPQLGTFANPAAGRLGQANAARAARVSDIMDDDPMGGFFDAVSRRAVDNARRREAEEADKDGRKQRDRAGPRGREDRTAEQFQSEMDNYALQLLAAQRDLARNAVDRYRIERETLELQAAQARRQIADHENYSDAQKAALTAQLDIKTGLERELLLRREEEELAEEQLDIARATRTNDGDLLQRQARLAQTRSERRDIELRLLDLAMQQERADLTAVLESRTASDVQRQIAEARLRILNQIEDADREAIGRDFESPLERYRREVGDVGRGINDSLEEVSVSGLDALNQGLTDALMGARSLGDVFSEVAKQIIADLLRIAIQQTVILPMLNALGGGGGGGGGGASPFGGLFGGSGLFSGFFAHGGMIPAGTFGIVGERGPEPVISTPRGALVRPNSTLSGSAYRPAGTSVSIPVTIDATGADAAALARVQGSIDRLRAELPATIVTTVRDATDRRILGARA